MKPTRFTLSKFKWLLVNPVFKRQPVAVLLRIIAWEWIRIVNRPVQAQFDGGHPIVLRPNEGASRLTYYFGNSEPETFAFMAAFLKPGMCVIDVGANIGLNTIFAARRVGESGRVLAIEPDPANFQRILENLGEGGLTQIELIEAACGCDSSQSVAVHSNREDSSRSFVSTSGSADSTDIVPVVTIDELIESRGIGRVDYLKIDVEGFEEQVLRGALRAIAGGLIRVLHVELDPALLERSGSSVPVLLSEIEGLGLKSCQWDEIDLCFRPASEGRAGYYEYFVVPEMLKGIS